MRFLLLSCRQPTTSLPAFRASSSSLRSTPWHLLRLLLVSFLLVHLLGVTEAVDNAAINLAGVEKQVADEQHHRDVDRVHRPAQGSNPELRDNPQVNAGNNFPHVNNVNLNNQVAKHQEAPVLPDRHLNVSAPQKLAVQEKEKVAEEIKTNDVIVNQDIKAAPRPEMEERNIVLSERIQQQERLQQQQGKNDQQHIIENQKEQLREQQWLAEVRRKSQEALAERQQQRLKQQDLPQQRPQGLPGFNQSPEDHDKLNHVVHLNDGHALPQPTLMQAAAKPVVANDISNNIDTRRNEVDAMINANKSFKSAAKEVVNETLQQEHPAQGVLSGELQNQMFQNKEIQPQPLYDKQQVPLNKPNSSEPTKSLEQPAVDPANIPNNLVPNNPPVQNRDTYNVNPAAGNGNLQSVNSIPSGGDSGQNGQMPNNAPNLQNNNNNQWVKYEFSNTNQNGNAQLQQQPQIGGINLSWDWEDFSIMFNSYGAAEMKVRRSPHPTTGEPWPLPQYYSKKDDKIYKVSKELHFIPTGIKCDILEEGLTRHLQRTVRGCVEDMYDNLQNAEGSPIEDPALRYERDEFVKAPMITRVEVKVRKPCDKYPSLESDESYDLVVKKRKTYIWANEVWGALRGLETFGHLVWRGTDGFLYIKETVISDYPRFPHRGLHIDTSRHFLFKEVILDILDSMEMNKLNVFHWHIVDDQSFPYESKVYPELSRKGAFHPSYVYTLEDIAEIIEYARLRGIRVMPEFDTPGHTYAWGLSRPELLTQCYSGSMPVKGYLGPIDPSKNSTYRFLQTLFKEIVEVFKDQYIHLGGDEVPLGCWQSNPEVTAFAQELAKKPREYQPGQGSYNQNNIGGSWSMWSDEIRRVYEYYENRLINILNEIGQKRKKGIKYVMWQEVMNNNLQLPNDTIIQVWMGDMADVMRATSMGYQVIYSTCWYLDHIEYGTKWPKYYNCDPVDQSFGFQIDEKKVLGGEAAFWAEYFSNENLIPLMWPRASAAAERLWSNKEVKNLDKAAERLTEHRCRMIKRGINAGEINGPGYCLHAPPRRRLYNDTAGCKGGNCSRTHNFVQIEDFEVHLSQRGGSLADCGNVFSQGNGNVFIVLSLALIVVVALYALSKSSSHFHRMRICKNRSILLVFVGVLLVYILCYTTIWMRAFEFSGSFHKTLQEDNRSGSDGNDEDNSNFRPISS